VFEAAVVPRVEHIRSIAMRHVVERPKYKLEVISEADLPADRRVFSGPGDLAGLNLMQPEAESDLVCGECLEILIAGQTAATVWRNLVSHKPAFVQCPACESYNKLPHRTGGPAEIWWAIPDEKGPTQ
jgi:hypothetical protein